MEIEALSTYAKGDRFEELVFEFLSREINEGRFYFFRPECCNIFRKKGYYSRDREDFIVFDISVEVFLPGFEIPSLLVLIECKNYSGKVPVGDIEEFGSKINQVAGFNAKGIFASASAFQSGTFNIARNRGFGVLRYFDQSEFRWELPRALLAGARSARARKRAEIEYALTQTDFRPTVYSAYAVTPAGFTDGWEGIWKGLDLENAFEESDLSLIRQPMIIATPRVAFISRNRIDSLAQQALKSILYIRGEVDLTKLVSREADVSGLSVSFIEDSGTALGSITFNPLEIKIFGADSQSHLARFTLAHELGHHFLGHKRYMTREAIRAQDIDQSQLIAIPRGEVERLEWQANTFASCLLMPKEDFQAAFGLLLQHLGIRNRGHGHLYLDSQRDNVIQFHAVCNSLSDYFNVSKTAIRLRMKALELLVEVGWQD
ncbi:ImmA/IrrE family metallo-endopeptidase [Pseudomonas sp. P867]|uniref:ImmA/IrrE family metallo-endopeptidase n=1 Tax=Pseudomonas sp. P867 TaxID=2816050 RepID=UPI001CA60FCB|nr:ImmA/IrrE family metallo-endopeptidase [Pseudomonas sp. P867]MBY8972737.1 ImmA/IrrE family metallo-endopeptidase [Pseudomonas sp. P867]